MSNIVTKKGICINGKEVVPCIYDDMMPAIVNGEESKNLYLVILNNAVKVVKIHEDQETYHQTIDEFCVVEEFTDGVAIVADYCERFGIKSGLINDDLEVLLDCVYDEILPLSNKLYSIRKNGKYGVYDANKKEIVVAIEFSGIAYSETFDGNQEKFLKLTLEI